MLVFIGTVGHDIIPSPISTATFIVNIFVTLTSRTFILLPVECHYTIAAAAAAAGLKSNISGWS